jgi:arylformamidase
MLYDISRLITGNMLSYPGDPAPVISRQSDLERGDPYSFSLISFHSHCGTHLDAPAHFIAGARYIEDYTPAELCPLVEVLDCRGKQDISAACLQELSSRTDSCLLLRTDASDYSALHYEPEHPSLTLDAAKWLVARSGRLLGIDYLSVERDGDGRFPVHKALLGAGFLLLEYIDLSAVPPGVYRLICLPIRLADAEAAPCRAVLTSLLDPL